MTNLATALSSSDEGTPKEPEFPLMPATFVALKAPKRAKARESKSDLANTIRRVTIDLTVATEEKMTVAWAYGCYLFDNRCYICGGEFSLHNGPQADHVVPPVLGGSINAGNMLPAHGSCNSDKGEQDPESYFADRPDILNLIHLFQRRFGYSPDEAIYEEATEIAKSLVGQLEQAILHARNARDLSLADTGEDSIEKLPIQGSPQVNNLMRGVDYYLKAENFAPTARSKVLGYARRILNSWQEEYPDKDLFTAEADVLHKFLLSFYLSLTDKPDTFRRAHRAFRVLAEVFESPSLKPLYAGSPPYTLAFIQEGYSYSDGCWSVVAAEES